MKKNENTTRDAVTLVCRIRMQRIAYFSGAFQYLNTDQAYSTNCGTRCAGS
jgi:hypothetical protein